MFWDTVIYKTLRKFLSILADHATGFRVRSRCHFYLGFRFLLVHATGLPVLCYSYSHFLLMRDAV